MPDDYDDEREQMVAAVFAERATRYRRPDYDEMVAQFGCSTSERPRLPGPVEIDPWRPRHCQCGAQLSVGKLIPECLECRLVRLSGPEER